MSLTVRLSAFVKFIYSTQYSVFPIHATGGIYSLLISKSPVKKNNKKQQLKPFAQYQPAQQRPQLYLKAAEAGGCDCVIVPRIYDTVMVNKLSPAVSVYVQIFTVTSNLMYASVCKSCSS